jgi:hypothetical protein
VFVGGEFAQAEAKHQTLSELGILWRKVKRLLKPCRDARSVSLQIGNTSGDPRGGGNRTDRYEQADRAITAQQAEQFSALACRDAIEQTGQGLGFLGAARNQSRLHLAQRAAGAK